MFSKRDPFRTSSNAGLRTWSRMLMMLDPFISIEHHSHWGAIGRAGSKINILDLGQLATARVISFAG